MWSADTDYETSDIVNQYWASRAKPTPQGEEPLKGEKRQTESIGKDFVIYFGRYKGEKLGDIPIGYLVWLKDNIPDKSAALEAALREMRGIEQGSVSRRIDWID